MIEIIKIALQSQIIIILTVIYFFAESIATFDMRLIQARRSGTLTKDDPMLPSWISIFIFLGWGILITLFILNWKYAIIIFVIKFILQVFPILETIGNILTSPLKTKK